MKHFAIASREEAVRFEDMAEAYAFRRIPASLREHFSLVAGYDFCQRREDDGRRIFAAIFDIYINFKYLYFESTEAGASFSRTFAMKEPASGNILDSPEQFEARMDMQRMYSAFVLRYRALWDKIMGLLVMIGAPGDYDSYASAASRKKAFRRICTDSQLLDAETLENVMNMLTAFDNRFRTPEAHGTGSLRKSLLSMLPPLANPAMDLHGHWNAVLRFLRYINREFFLNSARLASPGDPNVPDPGESGESAPASE